MAKLKNLLLVIAPLAILAFTFAPNFNNNSSETAPAAGEEEKINWITFEQLDKMAQSSKWSKEKKKIFVDVFAVWCGPCKMLNKNTFSDPKVIKYMNENFYAIKFDAETEEDIIFGNRTYEFVKGGRKGTNTLAYALANVNGRLAYPTLTFLDDKLNKIESLQGYRGPEQLMDLLAYYGEDHYKTTSFDKYLQKAKDPMKNGTLGD